MKSNIAIYLLNRGVGLIALFSSHTASWSTSATASVGTITITEVHAETNSLEFSFTSTWPRGTSYQQQFLRSIGGIWLDLPDARAEEVDARRGEFRATAPRFGGESGFYRVLNSVSLPIDPVQDTLEEAEPDEILLFWSQPGLPSLLKGKVYYHVESPAGGPVNNTFEAYPTSNFGEAFQAGDSGTQDVLMSDLDGDGRVDPLVAWANPLNQITISVAEIVSTNLTWLPKVIFPMSNLVVRPEQSVPPLIRVLRAHVDDSPSSKLWLAYTGMDGFVHIVLLELDAEFATIRVVSEVADAPLPFASNGSLRDRSARFDIAAADFDGDGIDEVALLAAESITVANGIENWRLNARFYDYNPVSKQFIADTIPAQDKVLYTHDNRATRWLSRVAGLAADFDGDGRAELAAAYQVGFNDQASPWFLQFLKPAANLASLSRSPAQGQQVDQTTGSNGYPLDLAWGEFDGDPLPELVYGSRKLILFNIQTNLSFSSLTEGSINTESSSSDRRFMTLANLDSRDPNTGFRPEIVAVTDSLINGNSQRRFSVRSLKVTGDSTSFYRIDDDAVLADETETSNNSERFFALGAADFGGNGAKLGTPRRYTRTVTGKPVVIVNAPPVHFDILDGVTFDVNDQFPVAGCPRDPDTGNIICGFFSRYAAGSAQSVTVETRWERGWDVSIKAEGGFKLPIKGIGVEVEVQTKFGERFDTFTSTSESTVVEVQTDAITDDRVYAATVIYNVWEYPVLVDGETVAHIIAIDPQATRQDWFGSKSIIAQNYRPYHEVGNLLSYRSATVPYPGAEYVRGIETGDTFTVDSSSAYTWRLTRLSNQTTTGSRTFNFSVNATASFDIPIPFIPNLEVSGGYDSSKLESNTSSISDEQGLASFLGAIDGTIAGTAYSITPYLYWDRSGAVVLDYAVDLPTGTPSVPTFWGRRYSVKSDPAFILPWRLDPEKGEALLESSQRQLTREIMTIPQEPRPGEDVDLIARISNFSFLATPTSFRARFYLGDPANAGRLLTSTDGRDNILVPAGVPDRGKYIVHFPWRVPESATSVSIQIYAAIDADNQLDEIHEDNNVGWNEIFLRNTP